MTSTPATRFPGAAMWTLLAACLVVYSAQGMLVPILAPMTRLVGLKEVDLGAIMTLAAAMLVLTGPAWARVAERRGVTTVLLRGLILALVQHGGDVGALGHAHRPAGLGLRGIEALRPEHLLQGPHRGAAAEVHHGARPIEHHRLDRRGHAAAPSFTP